MAKTGYFKEENCDIFLNFSILYTSKENGIVFAVFFTSRVSVFLKREGVTLKELRN